jgi:broad specificity phosphatase PhoE
MTKKLYLLRHGTTGADGRFIGITDLPLTKVGEEQVRSVRPVVESASIQDVFCSPMTRCLQTLELLKLTTTIKIIEDAKEINFGLWENLDFATVNSKYPDKVTEWVNNPETFTFPQGESLPEFIVRLERVKKTIENHHAENVLVVCHGGVIRYMICLFLHLPLSSAMLFNASPGCCTEIDIHDSGGVLAGFNLTGKYNGEN